MKFTQAMSVAVAAGSICSGVMAQSTAVQWTVASGGNGHWYAIRSPDVSWAAKRQEAEGLGGHLATIRSNAEMQFVLERPEFAANMSAWIGFYRDGGYGAPWRWVTGEPFDFTPWATSQPCPCNGSCNCATEWAGLLIKQTQIWGTGFADGESPPCCGGPNAVFEWSADCNSDGIVDYGQCRNGTLADANANNVPDGCEGCPLAWTQTPTSIALPPLMLWYGPGAVFLDANGDGTEDVVFSSQPVKCRLGLGSGLFGPQIESDTNGWREGECVGDLNGDGNDDFVTFTYFGGIARVMMSLGDGRFAQSQALSVGNYSTTDRVGDMDGDGDLDIVAGTELEGYLRIFRNDGNGTFGNPVTISGAGAYHREMVLTDLDGDTDLDIVVQNEWQYTTVRLFRNDGGMAFSQMTPLSYPGGHMSIVVVDFDHDGDADLVGTTKDGEIRAYVQSPQPFTFTVQSLVQLGSDHDYMRLSRADFDNNGITDLFISDEDRYGLALGLQTGGFAAPTFVAVPDKNKFQLVDLNDDGALDIAAGKQTQTSAGTLTFFLRDCADGTVDPCPGDINLNSVVDAVDLAMVLTSWGTSGSEYPRADVNHDGVVNGPDLGALLGGWGSCP